MTETINHWRFDSSDLQTAIVEETGGSPELFSQELSFMERVQSSAQSKFQGRTDDRGQSEEDRAKAKLLRSLIKEKDELVGRVERLTAFLDRDDFEEIVETDLVRDKMSDQHDGMLIYLKALCFRIGMLS